MQNDFIIIPSISIRPEKVVAYKSVFRPQAVSSAAPEIPIKENKPVPVQTTLFDFSIGATRLYRPVLSAMATIAQVKKQRPNNAHNFELSASAQRNLRDKVSWLYHYAKNQTITTHNGKILSGFKMNFVTLKLPSVQQHASDFITKNCLNQLFIEIAKKYSFRNYVWRLEYQKNGNLHYHIATDTYIDFYWLRGAWNRILDKYGYVAAYKAKFEPMSFQEYCKATDIGGTTDVAVLSHRYAEGKRNGWRQPNSVDVKCVSNHKAVQYYISKYMGKNSQPASQVKLPVCEDNSSHSRLWFCSRSLSRLKAIADFAECFKFDVLGVLHSEPTVKKVVHDYCVCFYYSFRELSVNARRLLSELFREYGISQQYLSVL